MQTVTVLGSTGSIGLQTLEVCRTLGITVRGLACSTSLEILVRQIEEFAPDIVSVRDVSIANTLKKLLIEQKINITPEIEYGSSGVNSVALAGDSNTIVVAAMMGFAGLMPVLTALRHNRRVALANKETLVASGSLVMAEVARLGLDFLRPVDSEHSAIWQCLAAGRRQDLHRIFLTASGGPFRLYTKEQLDNVTVAQALAHPTWQMGQKITIDSATMMNKGLELIEACWLFGVSTDQVKIVIHPQSIVHSMVQFKDGSTLAQLGFPDMKVPIQTALTWPERLANKSLAGYDPCHESASTLTFANADTTQFPCLRLADEAWQCGGSMPTALNAANEVAVAGFLEGKCSFKQIAHLVEVAMSWHMRNGFSAQVTIDDIIETDKQVRTFVRNEFV